MIACAMPSTICVRMRSCWTSTSIMTERSHAARRAKRAIGGDFPEVPTLGRAMPLDGIALVLSKGAPWPSLRPLRDRVHAIASGALEPDGTDVLVLVLFTGPTRLAEDLLPAALPLIAADAFTIRSFAGDGMRGADRPRPIAPGGLRRVELWWKGRLHRIAIDLLVPIPIVTLWDLPQVEVHWPTPRRAPAGEWRTERCVAADAGEAGLASAEATVSRAILPLDLKNDGLGDMTTDLSGDLASPLWTLKALLSRWTNGAGAARAGSTGSGGGGNTPRGPGLLSGLAGWLKWRTPLGSGLRRQFSDRFNQVERLIANGDIDGALKLALRLGAEQQDGKVKVRYPNQLPGQRGSLDFDLTSPSFSLPVMAGEAFQAVSQRYRTLADQLERDGDYRRAAYIRSQLLGDHRGGVAALERGGMFREGAKLALDARLEPAIAIGLFFKAGELDVALALARRAACFEQLAEDSRRKEPGYHAYVIKAWTDMLVDSGQMLRALQVTDHLANVQDADPMLLAERKRWIAAMLDARVGDGLRAEPAARSLVTAGWMDGLSPGDIADFPRSAAQCGTAYSALPDWMDRLMRGAVDNAGDQLIELVASLGRVAAPDSPEQAAFWSGPAAPVFDMLARALITLGSDAIAGPDLQTLRALLEKARLPVLAADIGKIGKLMKSRGSRSAEWRIPPADSLRPVVRCACMLADGALLAWRDNGVLELLDRNGTLLWRERMNEVVALIAAGSSPNAIIVQRHEGGGCQLTRFASHRRTLHPIGLVDLLAWHDVTSESQWLVQIGGDIGALDLAKLCVAKPQLHLLWSCKLTEDVRVQAFAHFENNTGWITRDIGPVRPDVLEQWALWPSGLLVTQLCTPPTGEAEAWYWAGGSIMSLHDSRRSMKVAIWTEDAERAAIAFFASRPGEGRLYEDHIQPCDFGRPYVRLETADEHGCFNVAIAVPGAAGTNMTLTGANATPGETPITCVARSVRERSPVDAKAYRPSANVVLADRYGRMFVVDVAARQVSEI
jgi:hypothetical protein